jgi:hypothetical protein
LEDRGKWKLYSYNITYGQVVGGWVIDEYGEGILITLHLAAEWEQCVSD